MRDKLIHALILTGVLLLPAQNGPAESFSFTFQTRWPVPGGATVHRLVFSPDGRWLAAAAGSQATIFEITADGPARNGRTVFPARSEITGLAFSPNGKTIAVVEESGALSLFESVSSKNLARVDKAHSGRARASPLPATAPTS
jgi:WD40 repeat protein